jgi:N-acetylglucosaminyldiphosphoundecaprenol N-acetyl-beta-D-mannosaminyltransferase
MPQIASERSVLHEKMDCFGVGLSQITLPVMLSEIERCVVQRCQLTITFCHFHTTNIIHSKKAFTNTLLAFDMVLPDGIAIVCALRIFGHLKVCDYIHRCEPWIPYIYSIASEQRWGIYLFGGPSGFAAQSAVNLKHSFPGIRFVGTHHGYLKSDEELHEVINDINQSGAVILIVGLGQPNQEEWIITNKNQLHATVIIGVGGYFDKVSKNAEPYPEWVNKYRLFWLYRLLKEPKRLWKRYTIGIVVFGVRVFWVKVKLLFSK